MNNMIWCMNAEIVAKLLIVPKKRNCFTSSEFILYQAHWAKNGGVGTLFLKLSLSLGNVKETADIWHGALQTPYRPDTKGIFHL